MASREPFRKCARPGCEFTFRVSSKQRSRQFCSDYCRDITNGSRTRKLRRSDGAVLYQAKHNTEVAVHPNLQSRMPTQPFRIIEGKPVILDGHRHDR